LSNVGFKRETVKYRAHRGAMERAPENTLPAFRAALDDGYDQIETDPVLTRDGVVVLLHDNALNRTCRNLDGSPLGETRLLEELTYAELAGYDAGIAFGEEFRGTPLPRLDELLALCEDSAVLIALDKKISTDQIDRLLDVVQQYRAKVCFSTSDPARIRAIQARIPDAAIDYDVNLEEAELEEVFRLVKPENLTVWLYLDRPNFAWLAEKAKATPERVNRIRNKAQIGIANIQSDADLQEALSYDPDVIEFPKNR
jgi:glycerophosphoryl diester phosphodiesterase